MEHICRGSKLALLHRVKERKTPSLSAQASFAPFPLKVALSGKSLIKVRKILSWQSLQITGVKPLGEELFMLCVCLGKGGGGSRVCVCLGGGGGGVHGGGGGGADSTCHVVLCTLSGIV